MTIESLRRLQRDLGKARSAPAGWKCRPDARCRRAEILTRAGRVEEATVIWEEVARDTPQDIWVYHNAGLEYGAIGDHETALSWLNRGLNVAVRSGDPERLIDQLRHLRSASLAALGREPDALQSAEPVGLPEPEPAPRAPTPASEIETAYRHSGLRPTSWAWLPASEYDDIMGHWPDIVEGTFLLDKKGQLVDHREYCRRLERRLRAASDAGVHAMHVAPIRWAEYRRWVEESRPMGDEPRRLRAEFAAVLGQNPARVISWPPGRNEACWCGSGRKYKKCCAAPGQEPR